MELFVADQIGQVQSIVQIGLYFIDLVELTYSYAKNEVNGTLWYEVPRALEPVQKMLVLSKQTLLVRRTGIFQLMNSDAGLVSASKIPAEKDDFDILELWQDERNIKTLLSNGQVWSVNLLEEQITFELTKDLKLSEAFVSCYDQGYLVVASRTIMPRIYDTATFESKFQAKRPPADKLGMHQKTDFKSILYFHAENQLICGMKDGNVWKYDLDTGKLVKQKQLFKVPVVKLSGYDKDTFLISNSKGSCEKYSFDSFSRQGGYSGHSGAIIYMLPVHNTRKDILITSSLDRFISLYDVETRKMLCRHFLGFIPTAVALIKTAVVPLRKEDDVWGKLSKLVDQ